MKKLIKLALMMLVVLVAAGMMTAMCGAAEFQDVSKDDKALSRAVDLLYGMGITSGTSEDYFSPDEHVTRQQMAAFVYRLMKEGRSAEGGENTTSFVDLEDPFYNMVISWSSEMGIIKGTSDTTFNPRGFISLQDAYVMLTRALGYEKDGAVSYPVGYISIAEDIGLDKDIPSDVSYQTYLTRGNVAILLYNAFYADMATGTVAYETEYETIIIPSTEGTDNPKYTVVETGSVPYTKYDTVAEKIFRVQNTVQRVVATRNYSLDGYEKCDADETEFVTFAALNGEYKEDNGLFTDVEFEQLGLTGSGDDYFLIDISVYYRENDKGQPEIVSASALGERKSGIPGAEVVFEKMKGNKKEVYYYGREEDPARRLTGKVTVAGTESYLFNAPLSYSKAKTEEERQNENITLLFLDATTRDYESEEFVQDFNFKSHRDVIGNDKGWYSYMLGDAVYHVGNTDEKVRANIAEKDLRGGGLYSDWGIYQYMGLDVNRNPQFEVDIWDSDSDGRIDYMWTKPYTAGKAIVKEGEGFRENHYREGWVPLENICSIYTDTDVSGITPSIYFYGATVDGIMPDHGQLTVGYINAPANYIKTAHVTDWEPVTMKFTGQNGGNNTICYFDGNIKYLWGAPLSILGVPGAGGYRQAYFNIVGRDLTDYDKSHYFVSYHQSSGSYVTMYFNNSNVGKDFSFIMYNGIIIYCEPSAASVSEETDYAFIFPDKGGNAVAEPIRELVNDSLETTAYVLEVMLDGELCTVPVYPTKKAETDKPITPKLANGSYDYSAYIGKPLTYKQRSDGSYVFAIAPFDTNNDKNVLLGSNGNKYYTYLGNSDTDTTFVRRADKLYQFRNTDKEKPKPEIHGAIYRALGVLNCFKADYSENGVAFTRMTPDLSSASWPKLDQWGLNINTSEYPYVKLCYRTTRPAGTELYADIGLWTRTVRFNVETPNTWESVVFSLPAGKTITQYHFAGLGSKAASELSEEYTDLMYVGFFKSREDAINFYSDVSGTVRLEGTDYPPEEDEGFNKNVAPSRYVSIGENAKIVIKTEKDDEVDFEIYDSNRLPDFDEKTAFNNICYVVRNNPKSTTNEELIYMYAEAMDGKVKNAVGCVLDYRIIGTSGITLKDEDGNVYSKYTAYNPFDGTTNEYEISSDNDGIDRSLYNGIVTITSDGYIADEYMLGYINSFGSVADDKTDIDETNLGISVIEDYDEENGIIMLSETDMLYTVTDETIVTFLDVDNEEFKTVDKDVLASSSKLYRCGENKNVPLVAFVISEAVKNEDEFENVVALVIVKADSLEKELTK